MTQDAQHDKVRSACQSALSKQGVFSIKTFNNISFKQRKKTLVYPLKLKIKYNFAKN